MTWADANAWCQQQGGRLPLIDNSDVKRPNDSMFHIYQIDHIDGFGAPGSPWPLGVPHDFYWTGTKFSDCPSRGSWTVGNNFEGNVMVGHIESRNIKLRVNPVACVP